MLRIRLLIVAKFQQIFSLRFEVDTYETSLLRRSHYARSVHHVPTFRLVISIKTITWCSTRVVKNDGMVGEILKILHLVLV